MAAGSWQAGKLHWVASFVRCTKWQPSSELQWSSPTRWSSRLGVQSSQPAVAVASCCSVVMMELLGMNAFILFSQLFISSVNLHSLCHKLESTSFIIPFFLLVQVVANNLDGGAGMFSGPKIAPIGGNIMAHASTTRLCE